MGEGGVGIGDWAQSPIPNPQSPIPNPQFNLDKIKYFNNLKLNILIIFNYWEYISILLYKSVHFISNK